MSYAGFAGSFVAESLSCSICCELLDEPKLLSCTHTFCSKCLRTLQDAQREKGQLSCPSCRKITHLKKGDVSNLQTNVPIHSMLQQLKSARKFCTICDADAKIQALFYCWQCNEFLCKVCHNAHGKFKKMSVHDVVGVNDVNSGKVRMKYFCDMHPHEELEFVCSSCKVPICFRCRVLSHSGDEHEVVDILAFQKTVRNRTDALCKEAEKKTSAIEAHIERAEEDLLKVRGTLDDIVAEIHQAFEECLQKLTQRRDNLVNEIQRPKQLMIKELEGIKEVNIKSLAHFKSICGQVIKSAEKFLEGDALVAHNKICNEMEKILEMDDPSDKELNDIRKKAESMKLIRCKGNYIFGRIGEVYKAQGNAPTAPVIAETDWKLVKRSTLYIAAATFTDMAPTPDGKMAIGYGLGGIDVFTLNGLQETVLQNVKVNSLVVLSDGRYAVRDTNKNVSLYSYEFEKSGTQMTSGNGRMLVDQEDNVYFRASGYTYYTVLRPKQQSNPDPAENECFKKQLSKLCSTYVPNEATEYYHMNQRNLFIRLELSGAKYYVNVRLEDDPITYRRCIGKRPLRVAVLRDDSILVGWESDGHVTIERYTYQLRYVGTVLSGYKIDGESFQLDEFSTGEIALCDGKAIHVFNRS